MQDFARERLTKPQIDESLEQFLVPLRKQANYRETEEEMILDTMDALNSWCHLSAELVPDNQ